MEDIKVWGKVSDNTRQSIINIKVVLLKKYYINRRAVFKKIDFTYTNQQGYYQFYIGSTQLGDYKVVVYREEGGKE